MNNNRKKIINLALIGAIATGGTVLNVGCDKKDEFSIVWNQELEKSLSLQPGESILLYAARDDEKAGTISYVITEGSSYATISNIGVLTVTKAAPVGQKIKVQAVSDGVKSTELVIDVVAIKEIELTTTATTTILERGDSATLNVNYKNSSEPVEDVTYRITAGSAYATLNNNVLTINSDAEDGANVTVIAETPITSTNTLTFTVNVPEVEVKYIIDADSTVTVDSTSTSAAVAIAPKVLDIDNSMEEVQLEATDLTYEVISGQEYLTVDASGYLTAIGHGQATVKVSYDSNDPLIAIATKNITVNAIVPPETITLNNMITYQLNNLSKGAKLGFGINSNNGDNAKLDLGLVGSHTTTTHFADSYKVNVYVDGATTPSTGYANYNNADKSLTFNQTAIGHTLRVEVLTDTGASKETRSEFTIDVNAGYNIYDMEDLMDHKTGKNVTINLLGNCELTGNSDEVELNNYSLHYYGHTTIYGNGYKIDFSKVVNKYAGGGDNLINIRNDYEDIDGGGNGVDENAQVKLYDLNLYGNNGYNMDYSKDGLTEPRKGSFDFAIRISGTSKIHVQQYLNGTNPTKRYASFLTANNIYINGFHRGFRAEYVTSREATSLVDGITSKVSNIYVDNCMERAIEVAASIMTLENVKLGRMGISGLETSPDVWWTAGENFDRPQEITFKGEFVSENHNAFNNTHAIKEEPLLAQLVKSIASTLHVDKDDTPLDLDMAFEAFVIEKIIENGNEFDGTNMVSLVFNNYEAISETLTDPAYYYYIREMVNGTTVNFEDLNGQATNMNLKLKELSTAIGISDLDKCQEIIMELFNSRFIQLEVPSPYGDKVDANMLAYIESLRNSIGEDAYNYLKSKLIEGNDIILGSVIVENPLYGVYSEEDFAAVKSPSDLLKMIKVQTVTLN